MRADREPVVLISFRDPPSDELRGSLGIVEVIRDGHPWVFRCALSPRDAAKQLLAINAETDAPASGAVMGRVPAPDGLWVAYEWQGGFVVQRPYLDALGGDLAGWAVDYHYQAEDLVVLKARRVTDGVVPSPPGEVASPAEFLSAIESGEPARIVASAEEVRGCPERWFGRLADPEVGGAVALTMTAPSSPTDAECVVLLTPAALGLVVDEPAAGLDPLVREYGLSMRGWGTTYGGAEAIAEMLVQRESRLERREVMDAVTQHVQPQGCDFVILAVLHARVDPDATIAGGTVFEQDVARREQNLIVAAQTRVAVPLGRFIPLILPAWCMNSRLPAPTGSPLRPTALLMPRAPSTQADVWARIDSAIAAVQ